MKPVRDDNCFELGSWGTAFAEVATLAHSGSKAIELDPSAFAGLQAERSGLPVGFSSGELWINGGASGGQNLTLSVNSGAARVLWAQVDQLLGAPIPAGEWRKVTASFVARTIGDDGSIVLQGSDPGSQAPVFVDDIQLVPAAVRTCPAEAAAGTSCSNANPCDGDEFCDGAGHCLAGAALKPDDGNPCTLDACSPSAGVTHTPVSVGTSCTSGADCAGFGLCDGSGACQPTAAPQELRIYDDRPEGCFQDGSMGAHDFAQSAVVHGGSTAAAAYSKDLALWSPSPAGVYTGLELWLNGGASGGRLVTVAVQNSGRDLLWQDVVLGEAGVWQKLTFPFSAAHSRGPEAESWVWAEACPSAAGALRSGVRRGMGEGAGDLRRTHANPWLLPEPEGRAHVPGAVHEGVRFGVVRWQSPRLGTGWTVR